MRRIGFLFVLATSFFGTAIFNTQLNAQTAANTTAAKSTGAAATGAVVKTAANTGATSAAVPVATAKELMDIFLIPTSNALFDVGSKEPKTDADWAAVRKNAVTLAEGGQLMLIPGRSKPGVWNTNARLLVTAGAAAAKAADAKNLDKITDVGDQILMACEGCHKQYLPKSK